jgi:hypothetical protein
MIRRLQKELIDDGEQRCGRRRSAGFTGDGCPSDLAGYGVGTAGANDPASAARRKTAQDRLAGGDERHSLFAVDGIPLALPLRQAAGRVLKKPPLAIHDDHGPQTGC